MSADKRNKGQGPRLRTHTPYTHAHQPSHGHLEAGSWAAGLLGPRRDGSPRLGTGQARRCRNLVHVCEYLGRGGMKHHHHRRAVVIRSSLRDLSLFAMCMVSPQDPWRQQVTGTHHARWPRLLPRPRPRQRGVDVAMSPGPALGEPSVALQDARCGGESHHHRCVMAARKGHFSSRYTRHRPVWGRSFDVSTGRPTWK